MEQDEEGWVHREENQCKLSAEPVVQFSRFIFLRLLIALGNVGLFWKLLFCGP